MDLAFTAAGGHIVAICERDEFCRSVLRKRWPNVPIFENVSDVTRDIVMEVIHYEKEETNRGIDVIFVGFPCQPFSVAGRHKAQNDTPGSATKITSCRGTAR
jgi:DNA (cytosine-5)-methyltransferase 1